MRLTAQTARLVVACALAVVVAVGGFGGAAAATRPVKPSMSVSPPAAAPGQVVTIELDNWPAGVATVAVCGNTGRRGSQDCDLVGSQSTTTPAGQQVVFRFRVTMPPVGCPCAIWAASASNSVVLTTSFQVIGAPVLAEPLTSGPTPLARPVAIQASVADDVDPPWPGAWGPALGGPLRRHLVVELTNLETVTLPKLSLVSAVGRDRSSATPLPSVSVEELKPGERRRIAIPFTISAPTWGRYVVFGSLFGAERPLRFSTDTRAVPWLLWLLALLFVADAIWIVVHWARARKRRKLAAYEARLAAAAEPELDDADLVDGDYDADGYGPDEYEAEEEVPVGPRGAGRLDDPDETDVPHDDDEPAAVHWFPESSPPVQPASVSRSGSDSTFAAQRANGDGAGTEPRAEETRADGLVEAHSE